MTISADHTTFDTPHDPLEKARKYVLLLIDADEIRSQRIACVLTLAGMRAIVVTTIYQAFERFLQERFTPSLILLGQQEEQTKQLFGRFFQRLTQELQREVPIMPLTNIKISNGDLLAAYETLSRTTHRVSHSNGSFLKRIWEILPGAECSFSTEEHTVALEALPKIGLTPHVTRTKRSMASHFHHQLKAARQVIGYDQWDNLISDVGLAQFRKEEHWPPLTNQYCIPPEYTTCLNRAVLFSNPEQPARQAYKWAGRVDSDILQKVALIFLMQQAPKIIGQDWNMRTLLTAFMNEANTTRGEKLTEWKRLDNGSFVFVFYSNMFAYGFMGASGPSCYVWQASFDKMLELGKIQNHWQVREIECSCQTHTGHCVFLFTPNTAS
ncbi:hypothetical protein KDA_04290 [Dictyobacter alpinus]|uniref:Uncharacterized protein n=1 Tax=Dictyobacter alpinus TaxID=2014873 RepID=A0A402B0R1_9CHLR|nr:V4R domain-containing protein [Dictyobacter alpinus]GCE24945.1 hypothetical protein KDA_04290 [Dictyobacter alpinus]